MSEQELVDQHEQARDVQTRNQASQSLIDEILLPEGRVTEAQMWCFGLVGQELRDEYQAKIDSAHPKTDLVRLPFNTTWHECDISVPAPKSDDQQVHYDRFIKYSQHASSFMDKRMLLSTWPGPYFHGLLSGMFGSGNMAELGILPETAAMGIYDYMRYVMEEPYIGNYIHPLDPFTNSSDEEIERGVSQNDPWALKEKGVRLDHQGNRGEAIPLWKRAAEMGNHASLRNLGVAELDLGNLELAEGFFQRAIAAGSTSSWVHLGQIAEQRGNSEEALAIYQRGHEAGDRHATFNVGAVLRREDKLSDALPWFRRAAERRLPKSTLVLAWALNQLNENSDALIWLERAMVEDPESDTELATFLRTTLGFRREPYVAPIRPTIVRSTKPRLNIFDSDEEKGEPAVTSFERRCAILGELWFSYREDEEFTDFIEYNDVGLPLAYLVNEGLATSTETGDNYINETWDLLIEALGADESVSYESLDQLLGEGEEE